MLRADIQPEIFLRAAEKRFERKKLPPVGNELHRKLLRRGNDLEKLRVIELFHRRAAAQKLRAVEPRFKIAAGALVLRRGSPAREPDLAAVPLRAYISPA